MSNKSVYPIQNCIYGFKWFPFTALTLLAGCQEGHPASKKKLGVGGDDLTGALHVL